MKVAWASDLHLDHAEDRQRIAFYEAVRAASPQVLLISGDIANGKLLDSRLAELAEAVSCRLCYVLGNHDFWGRMITAARESMARFAEGRSALTYLSVCNEPVALSRETCVIGHDGWSDGRYGDYARSTVVLRDYISIIDFIPLDKWCRWLRLQELGDVAASHLRRLLETACPRFRRILVVTHVPPWPEACMHKGKPAAEDWLPHYSCKAAGDVLLEAAEKWPDRQFTVLAGHTHSTAAVQIRANLLVRTTAAEYGMPELADVFEAE